MSDAYWDQTVLLLHMDGANDSTDIRDATYFNPVTANGNARLSTAYKKFGTASCYFDGTGDYLTLPTNSQLAIGVSDFTIEMFVRLNTVKLCSFIDFTQAIAIGLYPKIYMDASGYVIYDVNGTSVITSSVALSTAQWYHIAVSRASGVTRLFVDGTQSGGSWTDATNYIVGANGRPAIGASGWSTATENLSGYIDEVRITKNFARYTANFTPSAVAFEEGVIPLADDSPDHSANTVCLIPLTGPYPNPLKAGSLTLSGTPIYDNVQKLFGTHSLKITASGQGISAATYTPSAASIDYTVECFARFAAYPASIGTFMMAMCNCELQILSNGTLRLFSNAAGAAIITTTLTVPLGRWVHIAMSRDASGLRLHVDGVLWASYLGSRSDASALAQTICGSVSTGNYQYFRVTANVARYGSRFVPPTRELAFIPPTDQYYDNVVLHCHFDGENNSTVFTDQKGHTLTAVGSGVITTASSKFGGSCLNAGSGYVYANSPDFLMGTSDFTFEIFAGHSTSNFMGTGQFIPVIGFVNAAGTAVTTGYGACKPSTASLNGYTANSTTINSLGTQNGYTLAHMAICRQGVNLYFYINGSLLVSANIGTGALDQNGVLVIGGSSFAGTQINPQYYDEVRLTKGICRYPNGQAFTPSTTPFPDYSVKKLSGTTLDNNGNPISRKVRSYRSSDGLFVDQVWSNATTGAFELRATDTTEHFVVVHDDTKNALVYDHVVPVL